MKMMKCLLTYVCMLACLLALISVAHATESTETIVSHLYAFGDSSIDDGRAHELTKQITEGENPPPEAKILPDEDFFWEGRWSNGQIYTELIAEDLDIEITNYAVGGAFSGHQNAIAWINDHYDTGGIAQVDDFLKDHDGKADPKALYFIIIGWNDFNLVDYDFEGKGDAFSTDVSKNTAAFSAVQKVTDVIGSNVGEMVTKLSNAGGEKFVVMKLILGPGDINGDPNTMYNTYLSMANEAMEKTLNPLAEDGRVHLLWIDETEQTKDMAENPDQYGFSSINDAFLIEYEPHEYKLTFRYNPDELYYWDVHYTKLAHQYSYEFMMPLIRNFLMGIE